MRPLELSLSGFRSYDEETVDWRRHGLVVIAGDTDAVNFNPFDGRMATLPVYAFYSYTQPGVPPEYGQARAWGAALVLITIVMLLNVIARAIGRRFAPKTQ